MLYCPGTQLGRMAGVSVLQWDLSNTFKLELDSTSCCPMNGDTEGGGPVDEARGEALGRGSL